MIQADNLCKSFGGHPALAGLTFSANNGAITGLIGPNGSGKTTTPRLRAGLLHSDGGHVNCGNSPDGSRLAFHFRRASAASLAIRGA
jgi:ABC-2 type transport system ATP-binding protein